MKSYENLENVLELKNMEINELDCYLKALTDEIAIGKVEQDPDQINNPAFKQTTLALFNTVSDCINNYNDLKQKLADSQNKVNVYKYL